MTQPFQNMKTDLLPTMIDSQATITKPDRLGLDVSIADDDETGLMLSLLTGS